MDISSENSVESYFRNNKPDIVVHCAAISDTGVCERDSELSYKTNVIGSENIAKSAKHHLTKCIFCSSDQVYCGSIRKDANKENDVLNPYNVYGKHKAYAENSCLHIFETLHFDTSLLKPVSYENPRNLSMNQEKINQFDIYFSSTKNAAMRYLKNMN